jgi:hypothetical protein
MKTSSHTVLNAKGYIRVTTEYRLTPTEKAALCAIARGLYDWGQPGHVNIRSYDDKLDESKTVPTKACHALAEAGLLASDSMAMHGYQFNLTPLGKEMAALISA